MDVVGYGDGDGEGDGDGDGDGDGMAARVGKTLALARKYNTFSFEGTFFQNRNEHVQVFLNVFC